MKKLRKSSNKIIDGVLGGFANYFDFDAVWLRLGYLLFAFLIDFGTAFIFYLVAMFVMPGSSSIISSDRDGLDHVKESLSNRNAFMFVGIVLIVIGTIFLLDQFATIHIWGYMRHFYFEIKRYVWPVLLIIIGVWVLLKARKR